MVRNLQVRVVLIARHVAVAAVTCRGWIRVRVIHAVLSRVRVVAIRPFRCRFIRDMARFADVITGRMHQRIRRLVPTRITRAVAAADRTTADDAGVIKVANTLPILVTAVTGAAITAANHGVGGRVIRSGIGIKGVARNMAAVATGRIHYAVAVLHAVLVGDAVFAAIAVAAAGPVFGCAVIADVAGITRITGGRMAR